MRILNSHSLVCHYVKSAVDVKVTYLPMKASAMIVVINVGLDVKTNTIGITQMIRTNNRKNAGSRRNKRFKFVPSREREFSNCGFTKEACSMRIDAGKPEHETRFTDIADCFPLAGQRNLAKWKS